MKWTEQNIGYALSTKFLNNQHLITIPNCLFTGYECDLLCVTNQLRIIDFEIKISKSDFYADAKKGKWWECTFLQNNLVDGKIEKAQEFKHREHPQKVWKHYYVMPKDIWDDSMFDRMGSESCGVLLLIVDDHGEVNIEQIRKAKPAKDFTTLNDKQLFTIARLAGIRMWNSLNK